MDTYPCSPSQKRISPQLRAVLVIVAVCPDLIDAVFRYMNIDTEVIRWEEIFKLPLSLPHERAMRMAFDVWSGEPSPTSNFFAAAVSLEPQFQRALLQALAIRWGLRR